MEKDNGMANLLLKKDAEIKELKAKVEKMIEIEIVGSGASASGSTDVFAKGKMNQGKYARGGTVWEVQLEHVDNDTNRGMRLCEIAGLNIHVGGGILGGSAIVYTSIWNSVLLRGDEFYDHHFNFGTFTLVINGDSVRELTVCIGPFKSFEQYCQVAVKRPYRCCDLIQSLEGYEMEAFVDKIWFGATKVKRMLTTLEIPPMSDSELVAAWKSEADFLLAQISKGQLPVREKDNYQREADRLLKLVARKSADAQNNEQGE